MLNLKYQNFERIAEDPKSDWASAERPPTQHLSSVRRVLEMLVKKVFWGAHEAIFTSGQLVRPASAIEDEGLCLRLFMTAPRFSPR